MCTYCWPISHICTMYNCQRNVFGRVGKLLEVPPATVAHLELYFYMVFTDSGTQRYFLWRVRCPPDPPSLLGLSIPEHFTNPWMSGLKFVNLGIPGLIL